MKKQSYKNGVFVIELASPDKLKFLTHESVS